MGGEPLFAINLVAFPDGMNLDHLREILRGGAEKVAEAFKLILSDPQVEAILINIFGGIVRCDLIAEGILQAIDVIDVSVPVVVRLEGTNAEAGLALIAESSLAVQTASDLTEAAEKVVAALKGDGK